MAFIGNQPTAVPLTSSQLADGLITTAKLASTSVTTAKVNTAAITTDKLDLISTVSVPAVTAKGTPSVSDGYIQLNCEQNSHGIKLKSPPHAAGANYTLTFPSALGTTGQAIITNSTGVLSFSTLGATTGQVIQVISTNKTDTFASSSIANTFVDVTGLSVSITPSSASNKILVLATVNHGVDGIRATALKLLRDSTDINIGTGSMGNRTPASTVGIGENFDANRGEVSSINFLDSPATTSAITYKIQVGILESTANVARINTSGADGDATYIARSASTITVMEIKG